MSKIWFLDLSEIVDTNKLNEFYPRNSMMYNEKLNSFMRFSIYFSTIVFLLNKNVKVFYSIFFSGVLTVILYNYKSDIFECAKEPFFNERNVKKCTQPNKNNPFMNVLMSDYQGNVQRNQACDVDNDKIKNKMEKHFYNDLFKGIDEVYDNKYSYRQFYTTPNTTIPNDQEGFAKWLYFQEGETLKEKHLKE